MRGWGVLWGVVGWLCWSACAAEVTPARDFEAVKERIVASLRRRPPDEKRARALIEAQRPDGSWPDIPYAAKDRMIWPPMEHLDRLAALAEAYDARKEPEVGQAVVRSFDYWVARDPTSANWWYNEIGAVQCLYRLMLLAEPLLTGGRVEKGCALLSRAKLSMTGQNLVWLAENVIGRACLQRDPELMASAFKRIEAEIVVTEKEGIQPDFSFHQHGAQLYSGGYGNGFAASAPRFALLAQGTSYAFAPEKVRILESYLLDGQQWMIRGPIFDYSASGREPTRPNSGKVGAYSSHARSLLKLDAVTRREELERFLARLEKGVSAPALEGHRHFWRSDYTVHHRPAFMASVRLTSERLLQTEVVNEENLLGEHLSDGVMYLYRTGGEYRNIFPVWDWARLPGITSEHDRPLKRIDNRRKGSRAFAGGVSDGAGGVSAMDFERSGLAAKKAWFFFENEVVCLGAGISSTNGYRVITSINQCLADGPVTVKRADGQATVMDAPENLAEPAWVHHGGFVYVLAGGAERVGVGASEQKGNWKRISAPQKADEVSQKVFSLWLNHGARPAGASYAYVVSAQPDAVSAGRYAKELPVRVLANTPGVQAVEQGPARVVQAAFYEACGISSQAFGEIAVDAPCLLTARQAGGRTVLSVCDPRARGGRVAVRVNGVARVAVLPEGARAGSSVAVP